MVILASANSGCTTVLSFSPRHRRALERGTKKKEAIILPARTHFRCPMSVIGVNAPYTLGYALA
jgi:hypothetical protein